MTGKNPIYLLGLSWLSTDKPWQDGQLPGDSPTLYLHSYIHSSLHHTYSNMIRYMTEIFPSPYHIGRVMYGPHNLGPLGYSGRGFESCSGRRSTSEFLCTMSLRPIHHPNFKSVHIFISNTETEHLTE
jgi:hypothetical protein